MRYVALLLILCLSFFALNSVTQYRTPFSFLSTGNAKKTTGAYNGGRRTPHFHWATAAMMPLKGGPSAGTGLRTTTVASPASVNAAGETAADQAAAEAAIGTAASVGAPASDATTYASTSNPTHIQQLVVRSVNRSGMSAQQAAASATGVAANAASFDASVVDADVRGEQHMRELLLHPHPTAVETGAAADATASANTAVGVTTQDASDDAQVMDLASDVSLSADYLDLDLSAVPDVTGIEPSVSAFALSNQANAFAKWVADSIRNSLMDPHGIQFGGIASLNWSGASANTSGNGKVSGSPLTGFALGVFADIPLHKSLSFRPSLVYSYEGYQPDVNGERINIHTAFLSAPLDLVYHTNVFNKRLYVGAGPYAAYALNGTYTLKGINTDMQFGNNYAAGDNLRRMDFGANFMAGILMDRNFILGATFNLGLNNIAPSGSAAAIRTRSFGLSVGYVFRNRRNTPLSTSAY